jgi:hypothetical protein
VLQSQRKISGPGGIAKTWEPIPERLKSSYLCPNERDLAQCHITKLTIYLSNRMGAEIADIYSFIIRQMLRNWFEKSVLSNVEIS